MSSRRRSAWAYAAACAAALMPAVSCGSGQATRVDVFAASSLSDVFAQIEQEYERSHNGVDIVLNLGASSSLVAQLAAGAPGEVLATADEVTMARAVATLDGVGQPTTFATNSLVIAVENGNPLGIADLTDLARVPVVVLAAPEVPAGAYAADVLDRAGVRVDVASYEDNVRSVVSKVALGEADAGIVYRTDALATDSIDAVAIPADANVVARYPIVTLGDSTLGASFVAFVLGDSGRKLLSDAGFGST